MEKSAGFFIRNVNLTAALLGVAVIAGVGTGGYVLASATSNFTQVISSGTLVVDIVDESYATVSSPAVALGAATFSFNCQSTSGTFGTSTQQIYVRNPDAADNGWSVALAASSPTTFWNGAASDFDFNDPTTSGCDDGADADAHVGQMAIDASGGTLAAAQCASCGTSNITKGSASAFSEGATDSITILTGAAGSDDIGDWTLSGVTIEQTLPGEQPAASDYSISLTLSVTAS